MLSVLRDIFGIDNVEIAFIIAYYQRPTQHMTKKQIEQYKIDYKKRTEEKKESERQRAKKYNAEKEKTKCICGCVVKHMRNHIKTQKHQKYLNTKNA
jgi:hypothetical protein